MITPMLSLFSIVHSWSFTPIGHVAKSCREHSYQIFGKCMYFLPLHHDIPTGYNDNIQPVTVQMGICVRILLVHSMTHWTCTNSASLSTIPLLQQSSRLAALFTPPTHNSQLNYWTSGPPQGCTLSHYLIACFRLFMCQGKSSECSADQLATHLKPKQIILSCGLMIWISLWI